MSAPQPEHVTFNGREPTGYPQRANDLVRRLLQLEREHNGRGRVILEIVFLDGEEWLLFVNHPGKLERLGG